MEEKATLILVDFQKDFLSGTLAVKGAESALEHTLQLLESGKIERVIFTLDWHPYDHCSFKEYGGEWPMHCIEHTKGALPSFMLLEFCIKKRISYEFYHKGTCCDEEEYGAFSDLYTRCRGSAKVWAYDCYDMLTGIATRFDIKSNIIIAGIAGDYCVLETIRNLQPLWNNLQIYLPGIASIDGGKKLDKFIKENSLKVMHSL